MKIIHTADLHLDSRLGTNLSQIVAKERKKELLLNFERLIEYANTHDVDRIIISGDLFDTQRISQKTKNYLLGLISENAGIDFIYVTGNHEEESFKDNLVSKPDNLKLFGNEFETINYYDCDITGINYQDSYDFDKLDLKPERVNILAMHGDTSSNVAALMFKNRNIDYVALGHIHKYTKCQIDERTTYCYPGCLEGRGFDECGVKGFVLLEVLAGKVKSEFVPFAQRTLHEVDVNISECENSMDIKRQILVKISDISETDMIKVKLVGTYPLDMIKQNDMIEKSLCDKYFFVKISDESKLKINPKDYENDISLKGEFIRNVLKSDMTDEEKNQVIEYGIKALMKEEL